MEDGKSYIIVIGASAGGVEVLRQIASALPADLEAAVFVVLHTLPSADSLLPQLLDRISALPAMAAEDNSLVEVGKIYVAPPDRHLMFSDGALRVVRGPKENRHRPSIDVLFRSAAMIYGPRVIGVLLSGSDDDGTAGTVAIQRCGGTAVVQDPVDSEYREMPASAVRTAQPDFVLPANEIGPLLRSLVEGRAATDRKQTMEDPVDKSLAPDETEPVDARRLGTPSAFTCPDCNGTLWELQDDELLRYRCRIGHAYSAESMVAAQDESVERALWGAVRTLEESAALSRRIAQRSSVLRKELVRKAAEREDHARTLRSLLVEEGA